MGARMLFSEKNSIIACLSSSMFLHLPPYSSAILRLPSSCLSSASVQPPSLCYISAWRTPWPRPSVLGGAQIQHPLSSLGKFYRPGTNLPSVLDILGDAVFNVATFSIYFIGWGNFSTCHWWLQVDSLLSVLLVLRAHHI